MPLSATTGGADEIVPADSVLRLVGKVRRTNQHVLSIHRHEGGHSTTYDDTKQSFEFAFDALDKQ